VDGIMTKDCVWAPSGPTIGSSVPTDATQVFDPAFLTAYRTREWGDYSFVHEAFSANALVPFAQHAPIRIYQGDADTTVPEPGTHALVDAFTAGGMTIDYQVVPGGQHTDVAFGYVASAEKRTAESVAWVKSKLDAQ
jgi:hypothetical protein